MTSLNESVLNLDVDASNLIQGLDDAQVIVQERMQAIGEDMVLAVAGPILAIGDAVVKATTDISVAMATLASATGATGGAVNELSESLSLLATEGATTLSDGVTGLTSELQGGRSQMEALNSAADYFGATAGPTVAVAMQNQTLGLTALTGVMATTNAAMLQQSETILGHTEQTQMLNAEVAGTTSALGGLFGALQTVGKGTFDTLSAMSPMLSSLSSFVTVIESLTAKLVANTAVRAKAKAETIASTVAIKAKTAATTLATTATTAFGAALTIATGPIGLTVAAIAALIAIGVLVWKNWDTIKEKATEIWESIQIFFTEKLDAIKLKFTEVWESVKGFIFGVWDSIKGFIAEYWQEILAIIFPAVGLPILIQEHWGAIVDVVKGIWNGVANAVKSAVNLIIGFINGMIVAWNSLELKIPGFQKTVFGKTVGFEGFTLGLPDIPEIPLLDAGGIVREPTLAALAMNRRPEAVIPLDYLSSTTGGSGRGVVVNFNGDIYGTDDFESNIRRIARETFRRGIKGVI